MEHLTLIRSETTHTLDLLSEEKDGATVKIGGIIETTRRIFTKKTGSEMAFLVVGDEKGVTIECVIFPKVFEKYKGYLNKDSIIILEGHLDTKNDRPAVIVEKIYLS